MYSFYDVRLWLIILFVVWMGWNILRGWLGRKFSYLKTPSTVLRYDEVFNIQEQKGPEETIHPTPREIQQDLKPQGKFKSKGEERMAVALEEIVSGFGADVSYLKYNYRPSFLINPETGRRLEYDAYYYRDGMPFPLAFEFQGIQHYTYPNKFNPSGDEGRKAFDSQLRRDKYKLDISTEKGILLIRIPYTVEDGSRSERDKINKIKTYILNKMQESLK
jgi:hypothetical protein